MAEQRDSFTGNLLSEKNCPQTSRQESNPETTKLRGIANRLGLGSEHYDHHRLLLLAVKQEKVDVMKVLLKGPRASVNEHDADGRTPLSRAVDIGNEEVVECLLGAENIQVDAADKDGSTPLWRAMEKSDGQGKQTMAASIIRKVNVNVPSNTGHCPLLWAIEKEIQQSRTRSSRSLQPWQSFSAATPQDSILSLLLKREDLDVEQIESEGRGPLLLAVKDGTPAILNKLLDTGRFNVNSRDENGRTPLLLAAAGCHQEMIGSLLKQPEIKVCSRDKSGRTPLIWTILSGKFHNMEFFLQRSDSGINVPDNNGRTPLSWAAQTGTLAIVKSLLETSGVDRNKQDDHGRTPLSWAVENERRNVENVNPFQPRQQENERIVELLVEPKNLSSDKNGRTPLSWAAASADLAIVKYLVNYQGVDIEERDGDGRTPLSWGAEQGCQEVVDYFLTETIADVDSKDYEGRTPLYWATSAGNKGAMRRLLERDTGTLHMMAENRPDLVKLLLDFGYDACKRNSDGKIPLHDAVSAGNLESVKLLISKSPESVNYEDIAGRTPLKLAVARNPQIVKTLVESLAKVDEIEPSEWFNGKEQGQTGIVCLSKQSQRQSLHFTSSNKFSEELAEHSSAFEPRMRLFLCKDSPPAWRHEDFLGFKIPRTDDKLLFDLKPGRPPNSSFQKVCFYLATSFPTCPMSWCLKQSELLDMRELIISWAIIQHPTRSIGSTSRPTDFLSTLQSSSIPDDGAQFCIQFINELEGRWTRLLKGVENHLRNHRLVDFGNAPNAFAPFDESNDFRRSENLIQELQRDLSNLANLRDILNNHIQQALSFINKYCHLYNDGKGEKQAQDTIAQLELRGTSDLDRSDQMLRDLLTFVLYGGMFCGSQH
ncbi:Ankyrin repeat domain-containing 50 [Fusarium albosuccineum]|uniref:Ankyrin repeat domain-containing 50 n=1 Tax=Fusarium albosuccineum TaxID=1237068 RepID=A0A8H4L045_9HYPO|nr:Ankyrin repeat domain-containing 50 [Fusarium albosuccineum]